MTIDNIRNSFQKENLVVRLLTREEVLELQPIFTAEFENSLIPSEGQANIVGVFDGEKLQGFVLCEFLLRVGLIWVAPELRKQSASPRILKKLITYLYGSIPKGASVVAFLTEKHAKLARRLGLYKVSGEIYRTDL